MIRTYHSTHRCSDCCRSNFPRRDDCYQITIFTFPLPTPILTLCVRRLAESTSRCLRSWFRGPGAQGEEDGCSVDDWVTLRQTSGTPFRERVEQQACLRQREPQRDDDRLQLLAAWVSVLPEMDVQRPGGICWFSG